MLTLRSPACGDSSYRGHDFVLNLWEQYFSQPLRRHWIPRAGLPCRPGSNERVPECFELSAPHNVLSWKALSRSGNEPWRAWGRKANVSYEIRYSVLK